MERSPTLYVRVEDPYGFAEVPRHPLDDEDDVRYTIVALHTPTGMTGAGHADTVEEAAWKAKDDLLKHLEEAGGC